MNPVDMRAWLRLVVAVASRPALWATALRQVRRLAPRGWYRRRPYLPLPPTEYIRFRLVTMFGDPDRHPRAEDVLNYLTWCREWDRGGDDRRHRGARPSSR